MTAEEALQLAEEEGLELLRSSKSGTGFVHVRNNKPGQPKPYEATLNRDGQKQHLGSFATAQEAPPVRAPSAS